MGTNYYHVKNEPECPCCGHAVPATHIGKSSFGWVFALHVYPESGINNLEDWVLAWDRQDWHIEDEYGATISIEEMLERIEDRKAAKPPGNHLFQGDPYYVPLHGPNNLLRSKIDGEHCIGHGEGTWDLIVGDFS